MFEIIWEALRAAMVGLVLWVVLREGRRADISRVSGWRYIKTGAALVFFGAWIDVARHILPWCFRQIISC